MAFYPFGFVLNEGNVHFYANSILFILLFIFDEGIRTEHELATSHGLYR